MTKYSIYQISHEQDSYIGSTKNLKKRLIQHKTACFNKNNIGYNSPVYQKVRDIGNSFNNWIFTILEEVECETKFEVLQIEKFYIKLLMPTLNVNIPTRTRQDWNNDNPYYFKEHHKQWQIDNKQKISEYRKNKMTCECGSTHRMSDKIQHINSQKHQNYLKSLEPTV